MLIHPAADEFASCAAAAPACLRFQGLFHIGPRPGQFCSTYLVSLYAAVRLAAFVPPGRTRRAACARSSYAAARLVAPHGSDSSDRTGRICGLCELTRAFGQLLSVHGQYHGLTGRRCWRWMHDDTVGGCVTCEAYFAAVPRAYVGVSCVVWGSIGVRAVGAAGWAAVEKGAGRCSGERPRFAGGRGRGVM